jgi:hypothetical protein
VDRRRMTDRELILYLCQLLWDDLSDGDVPDDKDFKTLKEELTNRNIDYDNIFGY